MKGDNTRQKKTKKNRHKQKQIVEENKQENGSVPDTTKPGEEEDVSIADVAKSGEENLSSNSEVHQENKEIECDEKNEFYLSDSNKEHKQSLSNSSISSNRLDSEDNNIVSMSETSDSNEKKIEAEQQDTDLETSAQNEDSEYVNPRGVRFVQESSNSVHVANVPYGLPCVRELLRFLISLINSRNSELMVSMGLHLLTIALESGIDHLASYQSMLAYVKDDLCKNLYNLLSSERLMIFSNVLRISFFLFESLRFHLKFQIEHFFIKLMEIIKSELNRTTQEQKEATIDFILQMLRIPGFAVEIYINYDCSLNCSNLFEDLTKLLSKVNILKLFIEYIENLGLQKIILSLLRILKISSI